MTLLTNATIMSSWHKEEGGYGLKKEVFGRKAFFKWCCWQRMRRILGYQKVDGKIRRLGTGIPFTVGWYCEVCENREENTSDMM